MKYISNCHPFFTAMNMDSAHMYLFRCSSCSYSYPGGRVTLPVGSALHVGVFVGKSDPSLAVVLEDWCSTQSSNPDEPMRYFLIHSRQVPVLLYVDWNRKIKNPRWCVMVLMTPSDMFARCATDPRRVSVVENDLSLRASALLFPFPGTRPIHLPSLQTKTVWQEEQQLCSSESDTNPLT